jgi:hypothetical protein
MKEYDECNALFPNNHMRSKALQDRIRASVFYILWSNRAHDNDIFYKQLLPALYSFRIAETTAREGI